jgi:hypothetical protein
MPVLLALLAACAVHRVGLVEVDDGRTRLVSVDGGHERLLLLGEATRLALLGEHLVEVNGVRTVGRLRVTGWRALEGPHGMPAFVGQVQVLGMRVGVMDLGSGTLVFVDDRAAEQLRSHMGGWVAIEGYVDGPQHLQALSWRSLD